MGVVRGEGCLARPFWEPSMFGKSGVESGVALPRVVGEEHVVRGGHATPVEAVLGGKRPTRVGWES